MGPHKSVLERMMAGVRTGTEATNALCEWWVVTGGRAVPSEEQSPQYRCADEKYHAIREAAHEEMKEEGLPFAMAYYVTRAIGTFSVPTPDTSAKF